MRLADLEKYDRIVVQVHNDPDADAVGSGYAVYRYFLSRGKSVRLVYGGRNAISKSNMKLMISELKIPIEYVRELDKPQLLITVDCQYGQGNVERFEACNVAMIDHHSTGKVSDEMSEIRSHLVSCATVCYDLLLSEGFDINDDVDLATALYYGLYMDSNQLAEIRHPLDRDMVDFLRYDKLLINRLKYTNFSMAELETAGQAISNNNYMEKYRTSVIKSAPCDPNILGVIGDFVIQVDSVDVCVVFNRCAAGYKLSVRSCALEIAANELAEFLTSGVGNGGGHLSKAGGFINGGSYDEKYGEKDMEEYFMEKMGEYCDGYDVIRYTDPLPDISTLRHFRKKPVICGYVKTTDVFPAGTKCKIRTLEGDVFVTSGDDMYIMVGCFGEAYPIEKRVFEIKYNPIDEAYVKNFEYAPSVINLAKGKSCELMPLARQCISQPGTVMLVRPLEKYTKVFTRWDYESYMSGNKGDMLCYTESDSQDVYIVKRDIFDAVYEEV